MRVKDVCVCVCVCERERERERDCRMGEFSMDQVIMTLVRITYQVQCTGNGWYPALSSMAWELGGGGGGGNLAM